MTEFYHEPVLLEEILDLLAPRDVKCLTIDANTGEGGHSYNYLLKYPNVNMVCIDRDNEILSIAKKRLYQFEDRIYFHNGWSSDFFADYPSNLDKPDNILIDSGISSYHYKKSGGGFTFEKEEFLDMRLDKSAGQTAADLLAKLPERELADLFYNNAGERYSRRIAALVVQERVKAKITTTTAFAELVKKAVPASYRHGPIHPATRAFQGLRIAVNRELERLPKLLEAALYILKPRGRLGVISFHSSEDRIVKNYFRLMNKDCTCSAQTPICKCERCRSVNILTKKGITPGEIEIERNPPSRSARLRVVEKIENEDSL